MASAIVTCTLGTLPAGATATITIVLRPTAAGLLDNFARIVGALPESSLANNGASTSTVVQSPAEPITPPTRCTSMSISPRQLTAGKKATVVARVTASDGEPFADARVAFRGPGVAAIRKTNDAGVARLNVKAKRPGILRVTVLGSQSPRCTVRSGIVGVSESLTG